MPKPESGIDLWRIAALQTVHEAIRRVEKILLEQAASPGIGGFTKLPSRLRQLRDWLESSYTALDGLYAGGLLASAEEQ